MGTLAYAAPEQLVDSAAADQRADMWSLGVLFYELLAGQRPFAGRTLDEIRLAHRQPPDLDPVDPPLAPIVSALLAVDPDQRPTAGDLLAALPTAPTLSADGPLAQTIERFVRGEIDEGLLAGRLLAKARAVTGKRSEILWRHMFENDNPPASTLHELL